MGYQITAPELIRRVRARIGDRDGAVWSETEILERCDQVLERLWTEVRLAGRDHDLDVVTISASSLTDLGNRLYEYEPGAHIAQVRKIEGIASGPIPQPIVQAELHSKDWARILAGGALTWHRGPQGKIRFVGNVAHLTTFNIYFLRRWPPLHYGTAQGVGSTTTLVFDSTPQGRVLKQADAYVGHKIQFISGTAANIDLVVRVTAYNRSTNTITFTPAVSAVADQDGYSILVPLDAEHSDMVAIAAAMNLLASAGNDDYLASLSPLYGEALDRFRASLSTRDQDSPRTLHYTDR